MLLPHQRPQIFDPLPEEDYCQFYHMEMADYAEDLPFYTSFLSKNSKVLELGCGTGRLTRQLAPYCQHITGMDISEHMLAIAKKESARDIRYLHGDMTRDIPITDTIDTVIIPYNTFNLLGNRKKCITCLELCTTSLYAPELQILLQLYIPDQQLLENPGKRFFQFFTFQLDNGDKLIKETLKRYDEKTAITTLEERYKVRPKTVTKAIQKRDLSHTLSLFTPQADRWISLVEKCGFTLQGYWGSCDLKAFTPRETSTLFIRFSQR